MPRVAAMDTTNTATHNPLRDGNRLQRAYYRWAEPHYAKIDPDLREQVELTDVFLYTRQGLWAWAGWAFGLAGLVAGLVGAGMPLPFALGLGLVLWLALSLLVLAAWLKPHAALARPRLNKPQIALLVLISCSGLAGFVFGRVMRHGRLEAEVLLADLSRGVSVLLPFLLLTLVGLALLLWGVASASRKAQASRLATAQLKAERDSAARHAAEADLRLLQAQIQPHFVFNTLATLQHWVDKRDERAGPLLRELTGFLRSSTEMLGRGSVPLRDEVKAVEHYLAILQARLGSRLRFEVNVDPQTTALHLPPGLLLTLVENAIEHGLEPKLGEGSLQVQAQRNPAGDWTLQVDDDGVGLSSSAQDHVGLANLRQRLRHHYGARAQFSLRAREQGGTRAQIHFQPESA
jgi:signal transduction histidine kinase